MTHPGNTSAQTYLLGENLTEVKIAVNSATGGYWWLSYLLSQTRALAYNISTTDLQTELRRLPYMSDVKVDRPAGYLSNEYRLRPGTEQALCDPPEQASKLDGVGANVTVTVIRRAPQSYWAKGADGTPTLNYSTFQPSLGRTDVGNLPNRRAEFKAREWFGGHDILGGIGVRYLDEQLPVNTVLETDAFGVFPRRLGKPPATFSLLIDSGLTSGLSPAVLKNRVYDYLGRTLSGTRRLAAFDPAGQGTACRPAWRDDTVAAGPTWKIWPPTAAAVALTGMTNDRMPMIVYRGYAYCGWNDGTIQGYAVWNGSNAGGAGNASTLVDLDTQVIAFAEYDQKLFALCDDGTLRMTTSAPATAAGNWETRVNYYGPGYAYGLVVFPDVLGNDQLHIAATDGIYMQDFPAKVLTPRLNFGGPSLITDDPPQANSVCKWNNLLYYTVDGEPYAYDGRAVTPISWNLRDGIPTGGIALKQDYFIKSFTPLKYFLLANCSASPQAGAAGAFTSAAQLTVNDGQTATYYNLVSMTGAGTCVTVGSPLGTSGVTATLNILNTTIDYGAVMAYTGQGWLPLFKPQTYAGSGHAPGCSSSGYDELLYPPRLEFSPGYAIRWWDHPGDPYRFADQRWETADVNTVFPFFYSQVQDVAKTAFLLRVGYEGVGDGAQITAYWQRENAPDSVNENVGLDPSVNWVQFEDEDGNPKVIGAAATDPESGLMRLFLDRDTEPTAGSRGRTFYEERIRIKQASASTLQNPKLRFFSLVHGAKFGNLFQYPVGIDVSRESPDGRSPMRQLHDLQQMVLSPLLHYFSYAPEMWANVYVEIERGDSLRPGEDPSKPGFTAVTVTLAEQVRL